MWGNVLRNIWQFLSLLVFFPQQAYSCHYHVYIRKFMSAHIHTKEIRSLKDDKSQMQAMDVLHLYIKDNPLGNLAALQLQNI